MSEYEFDRYVGRRLMAQGARIERAASEAEALEQARQLFDADADPGEMARTTFVLKEARMSDIVETPGALSSDERLVWLLGDLMSAVENHFGAENPKRLGHINSAAIRIIDELISPMRAEIERLRAENEELSGSIYEATNIGWALGRRETADEIERLRARFMPPDNPAADDERDHLAEQCTTLMDENQMLQAEIERLRAGVKRMETAHKQLQDIIARQHEELEEIKEEEYRESLDAKFEGNRRS